MHISVSADKAGSYQEREPGEYFEKPTFCHAVPLLVIMKADYERFRSFDYTIAARPFRRLAGAQQRLAKSDVMLQRIIMASF